MNRAVVTALVATTALVGAGYVLRRRAAQEAPPSRVIPIITPVIDLGVAEDVLSAMERLPDDDVTVVLHTAGGCVTSCVLIANALRQFKRSRAIVPFLAISGGTLIALNARTLEMGRNASLSAVDPIVLGQRARHIRDLGVTAEEPESLHALAREYELAMEKYVRGTLAARLPAGDPAALEQAVRVFMGEHGPHEWPIRRSQVESLGIAVESAAGMWSEYVDAYRRRWWRL